MLDAPLQAELASKAASKKEFKRTLSKMLDLSLRDTSEVAKAIIAYIENHPGPGYQKVCLKPLARCTLLEGAANLIQEELVKYLLTKFRGRIVITGALYWTINDINLVSWDGFNSTLVDDVLGRHKEGTPLTDNPRIRYNLNQILTKVRILRLLLTLGKPLSNNQVSRKLGLRGAIPEILKTFQARIAQVSAKPSTTREQQLIQKYLALELAIEWETLIRIIITLIECDIRITPSASDRAGGAGAVAAAAGGAGGAGAVAAAAGGAGGAGAVAAAAGGAGGAGAVAAAAGGAGGAGAVAAAAGGAGGAAVVVAIGAAGSADAVVNTTCITEAAEAITSATGSTTIFNPLDSSSASAFARAVSTARSTSIWNKRREAVCVWEAVWRGRKQLPAESGAKIKPD